MSHLAVDVLETTHDNSVEVLNLFPLLGLLEQDLSLDDGLVDDLLVLETVDVFTSVRVEVLKRFGELVVETVHESDD